FAQGMHAHRSRGSGARRARTIRRALGRHRSRARSAALGAMTRAVVLLHGFTGSARGLEPLASSLAAERARVEIPALLGHGATDDAGVEGFEAEVDRLARHVRALGEPSHLVGYSLGGRLAIGLLVRHPGLFTGATLVSAQPGLATERERLERRMADDRWCG